MKTKLNFEEKSTKKILSKLDYEYYLKLNFEVNKYSSEDIKKIYSSYELNKHELKLKSKKQTKQFNYFVESQIRKAFNGGNLPALLELDQSSNYRFFDFESIGKEWAFFEFWKKIYNTELTKEKIWTFITRIGAVLAIILTLLKLYESIFNFE